MITGRVIVDELKDTQAGSISSARHSTALGLIEVCRYSDDSLIY